MSRRKAQERDFYDLDYKPDQDADPEDSDYEDPPSQAFPGKEFYNSLRSNKATPEATETAAETSKRLAPGLEPKQKTKLAGPPKVKPCKNTEICRQARARSEKTNSPVICRCDIKLPRTPGRTNKRSSRDSSVKALSRNKALSTTSFNSSATTIGDAVSIIFFWTAVAYGICALLRHFGYQINILRLPSWTITE